MNDPWDVKAVRQLGQYVSCMKINGTPLLPPVLSKECRKEMQYYKILAKEIEKRIKQLNSCANESDDSSDTKTEGSEISDSEKSFEVPPDEVKTDFRVDIDKITSITTEKFLKKCYTQSHKQKKLPDVMTDSIVTPNTSIGGSSSEQQKFVIDVSLSINESGRNVLESVPSSPKRDMPNELPERDYDCLRSLASSPIQCKNNLENKVMDVVNFSFSVSKNVVSSGPKSDLSSVPLSAYTKRFSGSLNNLHSESLAAEPQKLIRQRSYTVLNPSPQLLAHLEDQAITSGVEVNSISMSESQCNLSLPLKKRRSWDLESAKKKWSSMAIELNQKRGVNKLKINGATKNFVSKFVPKRSPQPSSIKNKMSFHLSHQKPKSGTVPNFFHSEPSRRVPLDASKNILTDQTIIKAPISPKTKVQTTQLILSGPSQQLLASPCSSQPEDPATRIRELYDKVQQQQTKQMASLMEKQKKEQVMLQKVFEEQNSILINQLKNICPKPPIEAKEAWSTKEEERGPVSLSQLIDNKSDENTTSFTLMHCDNVLKQSRDITNSIKAKTRPKSPVKRLSPKRQERESAEGHSPARTSLSTVRSASRKLRYDSSASSDRDYEPILTDRTNDTLADLNVTFPSDHTDDQCYSQTRRDVITCSTMPPGAIKCTESALKHMEEKIQQSIQNMCVNNTKRNLYRQPTPQELDAANRIVAHAKGYLVRRLMRTERVQTTVQTIRDALVCALQLHQDREGIRGADVDLHRRLIQQITAACYTLHDTFVASSPAERCALIAADRTRRALATLPARGPHANRSRRPSDVMSQSHSGAFPSRARRVASPSLMTQSTYGNPGRCRVLATRWIGMLNAFFVLLDAFCVLLDAWFKFIILQAYFLCPNPLRF